MTWRPRKLRIGKMRERISIQAGRECTDDFGQTRQSWKDLYTAEPAEFTPVTGGEFFRGRTIDPSVSTVFVIHWREGIDTKCRVLFRGIKYGIVYAHQSDGGNRYLELFCKATDNGQA